MTSQDGAWGDGQTPILPGTNTDAGEAVGGRPESLADLPADSLTIRSGPWT